MKRTRSLSAATLKNHLNSFVYGKAGRISLASLTLALGLMYVLQMNLTATKGYDIRALEQRKEALAKSSRSLHLQAVELQSVERILAQLPEAQLVKATPDAYLSTASTTFAAR